MDGKTCNVREYAYTLYGAKWMAEHGVNMVDLYHMAVVADNEEQFCQELESKGMMGYGLFLDTLYRNKDYMEPLLFTIPGAEKPGSFGDEIISEYFCDVEHI